MHEIGSPNRGVIIKDMMHGAVSDANEKTHSFRDKSEHANIYVRNHLSSIDRSLLSESQFKNAHLELKQFDPKDPNKKYFLRPKMNLLEERNRMRYQPVSTSSRV